MPPTDAASTSTAPRRSRASCSSRPRRTDLRVGPRRAPAPLARAADRSGSRRRNRRRSDRRTRRAGRSPSTAPADRVRAVQRRCSSGCVAAAIRLRDGRVRWRRELPAPSFAAPALADGRMLCVAGSDGTLRLLDVRNGALIGARATSASRAPRRRCSATAGSWSAPARSRSCRAPRSSASAELTGAVRRGATQAASCSCRRAASALANARLAFRFPTMAVCIRSP